MVCWVNYYKLYFYSIKSKTSGTFMKKAPNFIPFIFLDYPARATVPSYSLNAINRETKENSQKRSRLQ